MHPAPDCGYELHISHLRLSKMSATTPKERTITEVCLGPYLPNTHHKKQWYFPFLFLSDDFFTNRGQDSHEKMKLIFPTKYFLTVKNPLLQILMRLSKWLKLHHVNFKVPKQYRGHTNTMLYTLCCASLCWCRSDTSDMKMNLQSGKNYS